MADEEAPFGFERLILDGELSDAELIQRFIDFMGRRSRVKRVDVKIRYLPPEKKRKPAAQKPEPLKLRGGEWES